MLYKSTKMQLYLLFHKKSFQSSFLIVLTFVLFVYLYYVNLYKGSDISLMYHPAVLSPLTAESGFSWYLLRFFPFIAVLPASSIYIVDIENRVNYIIQSRQTVKTYYWSKLAAAFIGTFLTFSIPFLIGLLLNYLTFPKGAMGIPSNALTYSDGYFNWTTNFIFSNLYHKNIYLYYVAAICIFSSFAGIISIFTASISLYMKNFKILLFLPFYLISFSMDAFISQFVSGSAVDYGLYILAKDSGRGKNYYFFSLYCGFYIIASLLIIAKNIKKDQIR